MIHILILGLYNKDKYNKKLVANLEHYNISYDVIFYYDFDSIDFSKYSHIILSGSDLQLGHCQNCTGGRCDGSSFILWTSNEFDYAHFRSPSATSTSY